MRPGRLSGMTDRPNPSPGFLTMVPKPVPSDDPRVRDAVFAADGAWLNAMQDPDVTTIAQAVSLVTRTVLAHLDEVAAQGDDREGLVEVIRRHSKRRVVLGTWECMECGERLPTIGSPWVANVSAHQADAVARWLKGASQVGSWHANPV